MGNSGPLAEPSRRRRSRRTELTAVAVLSGNRNFEGRIHPAVRANFLASPPLVVAYALAGQRARWTSTREPLGDGRDGRPVYLRDIWPDGDEIRAHHRRGAHAGALSRALRDDRSTARRSGGRSKGKTGTTFAWSPGSTFIRRPPFFEDMEAKPAAPADIRGARVLGDVRRHVHHRPHLADRRDLERHAGRGVPAVARHRAGATSSTTRRGA